MNIRWMNAVAVLFLWITASPSAAAEGKRFTAALPGGGEFSLVLPDAWKASTKTAGPSVTVELSPVETGDFLVLLTVLPVQPGSTVSTPEGLRATVLEVGNQRLHTALQDAIELIEIRGDQALGYLYHLTDRNPERGPGDYREANQGMLVIAQHVASVTILTHSDDSTNVERAKEVLRSAKIASNR